VNEHRAPDPIRIGFVLSTEVGLRTHYLNWRDCLPAEAGVDPVWIVTEWWKEDGRIERLPLVPRAVKARVRGQLDLSAGLRQGPFDVLYVGTDALFYGRTWQLKRQPFAITLDSTPEQLHSFGDLYRQPSRLPGAEKVKRFVRQRIYERAGAIFAWSEWAAAGVIDDYGIDPNRVHVVPPGIDVTRWAVPARADDEIHVLFVGGDFHRKGGDLLLEWADSTAHRNWHLHLVTRDVVRTSRPDVHVYNSLSSNSPQLRHLYEQASVFALPTRADCYSIASIEAMASGLPVVLAQVGGTGDIVRDGETGYLTPPGDGAAVAARLDELLADRELRQSMGAAARADVEDRYDARVNNLRAVEVMRGLR
jgi:glycosyltransferase involved in cell wall biosynthesis